MTRSFYDERDYTFGQAMLTLRTNIGLTQSGLADLLGISRRSVGEWEAGNSYPKAERLKQLIELAIELQVFPVGSEAQAIRDLWTAAHQKTQIDEQWLSSLLKQQPPLPSQAATPPSEESTGSQPIAAPPTTSGTLIDWGQALEVPHFYGREQEMTQLTGWVLQERCRVVILLGMGGIGKSALIVQVMHRLAEHFDAVIFRPLRDAPSCEELLEDCLQMLAPQPLRIIPTSLEERLSLLMDHLRSSRTLLVLDNLESLLEEGNIQGHLRPGYEGYERLLRQVAETAHQSCLLLTSREKPAILRPLEGLRSPVHFLRLTGLDSSACEQLFAENEVEGTPQEQMQLAEAYAGNPLALNMVTETILDLFGGQISLFLAEGTVIFGNIIDLLQEHFARLSSLERTVLYWLAIVREPITLNELREAMVTSPPQMQALEAIDALRRRSIIERGQRQGSFTLQSVVLEYVTRVLIEKTTREIQQPMFKILIEHGLEQASAREYVRQTQERLLLMPILTSLQSAYRKRAQVEEMLLTLLDQLRQRAEHAQGYGPANLIALLRLRYGHLNGLDLSHLVIRGAYLRGIEMHDTSLTEATMRDTAFTEALDAAWAVATNRDGTLWAAGSLQGKIRVWEKEGQTLSMVWQAHTDLIMRLAFNPNSSTLTSASMDGSVTQWDLQRGIFLWTSKQNSAQSIVMSPDGSLIAGGGQESAIQIWDARSGTILQTLPHPSHIVGIAWSPDGQLLASGCLDGQILLWDVQKTSTATCTMILPGHSSWTTGLAFAPDGRVLVSCSWDQTAKLWDLTSGRLLQTMPEPVGRTYFVAWSPDGRTVAGCGLDNTIWLWDVERGRYRATLRGHTADVYNIVFTPDSTLLLSGSADGTIHVWDVARGQCASIIQGYSVSHYDLCWSPDGTQLASGDTNGQITIWNVDNETSPKVLRGHNWAVAGVVWSPDGQWLASSGWDDTVRVWDTTSWTCIETLQETNAVLRGIAWSPNGHRLAWGTYSQGVHVWDMISHSRLEWAGQTEQTEQTEFRRVAWSLDGTQIASAGSNGIVYLWDSEDGTLLRQLSGHHGMVASVAWSPDGTRLLSGGGKDSGEMFIWDVQRGEQVQTFAQSAGIIYTIVWAPSGDVLVSGGSDGILRWWDPHRGQCLGKQDAHQGSILSLRISPDGCRLASCGVDGAIRIWDLQSKAYLLTLRRDRPYERLNITGIKGLTEAQKSTLRALGAIEEEATSL